jgi:Holliday junction resolvase RusA-like endonuclease
MQATGANPVLAGAIKFFVPGTPKPGGSKKAFYNPKMGRAIIVDDCDKNKDWKTAVSFAAKQVMQGRQLLSGPLRVIVHFNMPRIKGHFRTNGLLKPNAPIYHTVKPDATKLMRSTEDALTGIVWRDDAEIAKQEIVKLYECGNGCGAEIEIMEMRPGAVI